MPIHETDRGAYPEDWGTISEKVREESGQRCEWCGVPNARIVLRVRGRGVWALPSQAFEVDPTSRDSHAQWHDENGVELDHEPEGIEWPCGMDGDTNLREVRIVLTVAHLDQDPSNCARGNLAALCQRCHLNYDRHGGWAPRPRPPDSYTRLRFWRR